MRTLYFCRVLSRVIRILSIVISTFVVIGYKITKKTLVVVTKYVAHNNSTIKVNAHTKKHQEMAYADEIKRQKKLAEKEKFEKQLINAVLKMQQASKQQAS